ncbi:hypothetical protein OG930_07065 [Streptomyces sp. NBC_01799]|uniref:OsmC family protein n=1 Tax=Streptomyces sp. NBC_01800 TaxID=2975945 RepID=UPI002DD98010|nr:hypothetical protein [Streptomyces sp. NBC_01800]WSA66761.1 hypothetical protein OIE65_07060 [Streptomyces sp. NBC_01800]WSA75377.1 hypothetical protein OG930_07065 [Streptomyces sp. NBC_01799]
MPVPDRRTTTTTPPRRTTSTPNGIARPNIAVSLCPTAGSIVTGQARDHPVIVDRPAGTGGSDTDPLGSENLLLALGGCYLSTFLAPAGIDETSPGHNIADAGDKGVQMGLSTVGAGVAH